jgi:hypothetical protein
MRFLRIGRIVVNLEQVTFVDLGGEEADGVRVYLPTDADARPTLTVRDPDQKAAIREYFRPDRQGGPTMNGDRVGGLKWLGAGEPTS